MKPFVLILILNVLYLLGVQGLQGNLEIHLCQVFQFRQ